MKIDLLIDRLKSLQTSKLDDFVDRLNYLYTTLLLVFFVFVVGSQQTFRTSLSCKPDANFPSSWVEYTNNYCYSTGTYHTKDGSNYNGMREKIYVNYYQWVPYTLALQALSFYLPHLLYLFLASFTSPGLKLQHIVDRCCGAAMKKEKELDDETVEISNSIYVYTSLPGKESKSLGSFVAYSYLISKALNLVNIALNIYFLNLFVGLGDEKWFFTVVQKAWENLYWEHTGFFPRITFCDMVFKGVGQPREHTIQCLLMINILIEKAYIIVYFWLLVLMALTVINFVWSIWKVLLRGNSPLEMFAKPLFKDEPKKYHKFCDRFMSTNGDLLIRFVNDHAGSVAANKLVENLVGFWKAINYPELNKVNIPQAPHLPANFLKSPSNK